MAETSVSFSIRKGQGRPPAQAPRRHWEVAHGEVAVHAVVCIHYVTNAITNAITTGGVNANMHHVVEVP